MSGCGLLLGGGAFVIGYLVATFVLGLMYAKSNVDTNKLHKVSALIAILLALWVGVDTDSSYCSSSGGGGDYQNQEYTGRTVR